jgi:hypothetical protein
MVFNTWQLLLHLKVFVGGILIAIDLHVRHMPLFRGGCLVHLYKTLQNTSLSNVKKLQ